MFFHCCQGRDTRRISPLASQNFLFYIMYFKMWVWVLLCGNLWCGVNDSLQNCPAALMGGSDNFSVVSWESFYISPRWHCSLGGYCVASLPQSTCLAISLLGMFCKNQLITGNAGPRYLCPFGNTHTFSWCCKPETQATLQGGELADTSWNLRRCGD